MTDLKMFHDGACYVVARDDAHATRLRAAHVGVADSYVFPGQWSECAADKPLTIYVALVLNGREIGEQLMTKTAAEWAETYGAGFLCATER